MIKQYFIAALAVVFGFTATNGNVKITGTVKNAPANSTISISTTAFQLSGQPKNLGQGKIDATGKFIMDVEIKMAQPVTLTFNTKTVKLFLEPTDAIEISCDANSLYSTLAFKGKGADANNYLAKYYVQFESIEKPENIYVSRQAVVPYMNQYKGLEELSFRKFTDSLFTERTKFLKSYKFTAEPTAFKKYITAEYKYDHLNTIFSFKSYNAFLNSRQITDMNEAVDPSVFTDNSIITDDVANSSHLIELLDNFFVFASNSEMQMVPGASQDEVYSSIIDKQYGMKKQKLVGQVRDFMLARQVYGVWGFVKNVDLFNKLYEDYKTVNINKDWLNDIAAVKTQIDAEAEKLNRLKPGKPAPTFSYKDRNGKSVSLTDFIGKVVYLDIWASWCGPCKTEIPFAKSMEEKLKGKDIVFLCVSIDKSKESWLKCLDEKQPAGIHICVDDPSAGISADYDVASIPRYVIIDKKGNLVDANAKRPSQGVDVQLEELSKQ